MKIVKLKLSQIKPYERNPRKNDGAVDAVAESIRQCGYCAPIVVDEDYVILAGHTRYKALKKLGWAEAEVVVRDGLTDEQKRKYRLLDNKTNELASWDFDLLTDELEGLDFEGFDFGFPNGDAETEPEIIEDEPPEQAEPRSTLGDVWQLGRHRLICGDCTDAAVINALMDGAPVDCLLTDPPYNVSVGDCERPNSSNNGVHIMNDSMSEQDFIGFLTCALANANNHMRAGAAYYIWYAGLHHIEFENAVRNISDFKLHEQLVWVKSHFVLGRNSDYQWAHEPCLYGWKSGAKHYFTDSRAESTVIEDVKLSTLKKDELIALCEKLMDMDVSTSVLRANKPVAAKLHPTVKPQSLLCTLLKNSTQQGWNVLDLFGGSGSTLIACEQLNRRCFMVELDPKYCDVIIQRYENFTGEKAVLLNGE